MVSLNKTNISWCTHSWNPITGCSKISVGCKNCYAEAFHKKKHNIFLAYGTSPKCYRTPFNEIKCWPDRLKLPGGERKVIFVCNMGDLFHKDVPSTFISVVLEQMLYSKHTFIILTKRPERMKEHMIEEAKYRDIPGKFPNLWLGVSVEDQVTADERLPLLAKTPAAHRFVSVEPLLEDIMFIDDERIIHGAPFNYMDVLIVGCESGPNRRPARHDWFRNIYDECQCGGQHFYLKQMSANPDGTGAIVGDHKLDGVTHDALPWGCE